MEHSRMQSIESVLTVWSWFGTSPRILAKECTLLAGRFRQTRDTRCSLTRCSLIFYVFPKINHQTHEAQHDICVLRAQYKGEMHWLPTRTRSSRLLRSPLDRVSRNFLEKKCWSDLWFWTRQPPSAHPSSKGQAMILVVLPSRTSSATSRHLHWSTALETATCSSSHYQNTSLSTTSREKLKLECKELC